MLTVKLPLAAVVAILSLGLGAATSLAAARHRGDARSACQRLAGRDLAPDHAVKVVWQSVRTKDFVGPRLLGCVLPRGTVQQIGHGPDTYAEEWVYDHTSLALVVGRKLVLERVQGSHYGGAITTVVYDVGTAQRYVLTSRCIGEICGPGSPGTVLGTTVLGRDGSAVALVWDAGDRTD